MRSTNTRGGPQPPTTAKEKHRTRVGELSIDLIVLTSRTLNLKKNSLRESVKRVCDKMTSISPSRPVIIIGAGIVGLTFAQSLKKDNIPFQIFERDTSAESRTQNGWGISIHWAREALNSCLPANLVSRLSTVQVDPSEVSDSGRFVFLNLSTAKPRYETPPAPRLRVNRRKFRDLLREGIDVQWGMSIDSFRESDDGIEVVFRDGSIAIGSLLVGIDGSNSSMRHFLCPSTAELYQLPIRLMGVTVRLTSEEIAPLLAIDPVLFQGCHPDNGAFIYYSVLSVPEVNGLYGADEFYQAQICLSWSVKCCNDEIPVSNKGRLAKLKAMARPFESRLRTVIEHIPDGTEVIEIKLQDWPLVQWPNLSGKVSLIGDAAHAMTMCKFLTSDVKINK